MRPALFFALILTTITASAEEEQTDEDREKLWEESVTELVADPAVRQGVSSATICFVVVARAHLVAEIRTEQRYAKELSGVQDNAKLLMLQGLIRKLDDGATTARAELQRLKKKPTKCTDATTAKLTRCIADVYSDGDADTAECDTPALLLGVAVVHRLIPEMRSPFGS